MSTIFRFPFVSRGVTPKDVTHARQWVIGSSIALLTAVTLPSSQRDWPLPQRPGLLAKETPPLNTAVLQTVVVVTAPFAQYDWTLPRKIDSPITRDWQDTLISYGPTPFLLQDWPLPSKARPAAPEQPSLNIAVLNTVVVVTQPFALLDWPLPQRPALLAKETPPLNQAVQIGPTPFAEYDWPLAVRAGPLAKETSPLNAAVHIGPTPFHLTEWPLAVRTDSPIPRHRDRVNDLPRQLQVTIPWLQYDWPLPRRPGRPAQETPPLNAAVQIGPTPFGLDDWPLAVRARPAAPETSPLNIAVINTVVVVTAPFAQLDWPLPQRPGSPAKETSPLNQAVQIGLTPFAFFDWTLPRTPLPPALETTITNVTAINTPVIVVPLPPALFDWPLPKNVPFVVSDTPPPVNPNIYPPVSGAPNYLRRLIQTEAARQQRLADQDRSVLRTMFSEGGSVVDKQVEEARLIEEEDEYILRRLDP